MKSLTIFAFLFIGAALGDIVPASVPKEFLEKLHERTMQPRVVGGNDAVPKQFPYQVGVSTKKLGSFYWCGGSVISELYVLTAAHCVAGEIDSVLLIFGATDRLDVYQTGSSRQNITNVSGQIIVHPLYNPNEITSDVALIRLNQKLEFSDYIQPARLPERNRFQTFANSPAVLSGWGKVKDIGSVVQHLQYGYVSILDLNECMAYYNIKEYDNGNICLNTKDSNVSSCNGDSGGPLVSTMTGELIGVTSFGSIFGCAGGAPTGYSRVTHFRDWINYHTGL
ncbi:hypothetical protein ACFFRR_010819 [Megaselia abdita]